MLGDAGENVLRDLALTEQFAVEGATANATGAASAGAAGASAGACQLGTFTVTGPEM